MENVTKALLIAAVILITIIIISITMIVLRTATSTDKNTEELGEVGRIAFNSKYESKKGICSGRTVKTIIEQAIQNNKKGNNHPVGIKSSCTDILSCFNSDTDYDRAMTAGLTNRAYGIIQPENMGIIKGLIKENLKYRISFSYNKNGYIQDIHIAPH